MNHHKVIEMLPWYVNKTLSTDEQKAVVAHLGNCLECSQELEFLKRIQTAVLEINEEIPEPPHDLFNKIIANINEASMRANEYQRLAARTLINKPDYDLTGKEVMILWNALGLTGEAGEVADLIKKAILHRHGFSEKTKQALHAELGDVLWYVSALCEVLGFTLDSVMRANIKKLQERYPEGYSSEASIKRS